MTTQYPVGSPERVQIQASLYFLLLQLGFVRRYLYGGVNVKLVLPPAGYTRKQQNGPKLDMQY